MAAPIRHPATRAKRTRLTAAVLLLLTCPSTDSLHASVVISEVHYHPPAPHDVADEFVELYNSGPTVADLSGWRLVGGVEYTFPDGASIEAAGCVIVTRTTGAADELGVTTVESVFAHYSGALANDDDHFVLVDAHERYVDDVVYGDRGFWPETADGGGDSLQRQCVDASGRNVANWLAAPPTPLVHVVGGICPPPELPTPRLVINEIHYHPFGSDSDRPIGDDGEVAEFLELRNPSSSALDVGGWRLSEGVEYEFPPQSVIPPGGFVVLARDPESLRDSFELPPDVVVAKYEGRLSNRGERLTVVDASGDVVESLRYDDSGQWPYMADGFGRSLERISAFGASGDPVNWRAGEVGEHRFRTLFGEGPKSNGFSQILILALPGTGEAIIDEVVLQDLSDGDRRNLIVNGGFESGLEGWRLRGSASNSVWDPAAGVDGGGALRLVVDGPCSFSQCGVNDAVSIPVSIPFNSQSTFRLTLSVRYVSGSQELFAGLFDGVQATVTRTMTPGRTNVVASDEIPPSVDYVGRSPRRPTSSDRTTISVRVRGDPTEVTLHYAPGEAGDFGVLQLFDDGAHDDRDAGDGVFANEIPPFEHNTQVRYWVQAARGPVATQFPRSSVFADPRGDELRGYYVNDLQESESIPTYHLLIDGIDGSDWVAVNDFLRCSELKRASFAFDGELYPDIGLRWRGNTACVIDKRNFKVRFNKALPFRSLRKLNFNGLWTDKSLVRERLAWDFIDQLGAPQIRTEYARIHVSGSYYGLYLCLEHPDERFLRRNGLDVSGSFYKARQPPPRRINEPIESALSIQPSGTYDARWEEEINEGGDFSDVESFVVSMHAAARSVADVTFFLDNTFPNTVIDFQLTQVLLNNIDSAIKNHFLYHSLEQGRWGFFTWDMDLVFGKFFLRDAADIEAGRQTGTLNDLMLSDLMGDLRPFFMTTLDGDREFNWLVEYFFTAGEGYFQRAYLVRLCRILEEKLKETSYAPQLDSLASLLWEEQTIDFERWGRYPSNVENFPEDMLSNLEIVEDQISKHRRFLAGFVRQEHADIMNAPVLRISEIMYRPMRDELEFLELVNVSPQDVDVGGWAVVGIGYTFPARTVVAAGETVVLAKSPRALREEAGLGAEVAVFGPYPGRLANDGELLRVEDSGPGFPATVDLVRYRPGEDWPETRPGYSLQLLRVSRSTDNDSASAWTVSSALGGDPGSGVQHFVRGDANADERLNVSDAIFVLLFVYRGGQEPICLDAADANDDGLLDLGDAVTLLGHLFGATEVLPEPYPEIGPDPTSDTLGCR